MITLEDLRAAVNAACTCGGSGPDDPNVCPACEVWHALKPRPARERPEKLRPLWPLTSVSWMLCDRPFVAWMFAAGRRCNGKAATRRQWKVWRAAHGRHTGAPGNSAAIRESRDK